MNAGRVALLIGWAGSLSAQAPDSAGIRYRDALIAVREALAPIGAGVQSLRRDLPTAADVTVLAKARTLQQACRGAIGTLRDHRPVFERVEGSARHVEAARRLVGAMRALEDRILEHCLTGLARGGEMEADSVRAWLPFRAARLREAERDYQNAASNFARVADVRLPPSPGRGS